METILYIATIKLTSIDHVLIMLKHLPQEHKSRTLTFQKSLGYLLH